MWTSSGCFLLVLLIGTSSGKKVEKALAQLKDLPTTENGTRLPRSIGNFARLLLGGNVPPDHPLVQYPDPIYSPSSISTKVIASVPGMTGDLPHYPLNSVGGFGSPQRQMQMAADAPIPAVAFGSNAHPFANQPAYSVPSQWSQQTPLSQGSGSGGQFNGQGQQSTPQQTGLANGNNQINSGNSAPVPFSFQQNTPQTPGNSYNTNQFGTGQGPTGGGTSGGSSGGGSANPQNGNTYGPPRDGYYQGSSGYSPQQSGSAPQTSYNVQSSVPQTFQGTSPGQTAQGSSTSPAGSSYSQQGGQYSGTNNYNNNPGRDSPITPPASNTFQQFQSQQVPYSQQSQQPQGQNFGQTSNAVLPSNNQNLNQSPTLLPVGFSFSGNSNQNGNYNQNKNNYPNPTSSPNNFNPNSISSPNNFNPNPTAQPNNFNPTGNYNQNPNNGNTYGNGNTFNQNPVPANSNFNQNTGNTYNQNPGTTNTNYNQYPNTGNTYNQNPGPINSNFNQNSNPGNTFDPNLNTGNTYNQKPNTGNTYNQNPDTGNTYNQNPNTGNTYNQNLNTGNTYNQNPTPVNTNFNQNQNAGNTYNKNPTSPLNQNSNTGNTLPQNSAPANTNYNQNGGTGSSGTTYSQNSNSGASEAFKFNQVPNSNQNFYNPPGGNSYQTIRNQNYGSYGSSSPNSGFGNSASATAQSPTIAPAFNGNNVELTQQQPTAASPQGPWSPPTPPNNSPTSASYLAVPPTTNNQPGAGFGGYSATTGATTLRPYVQSNYPSLTFDPDRPSLYSGSGSGGYSAPASSSSYGNPKTEYGPPGVAFGSPLDELGPPSKVTTYYGQPRKQTTSWTADDTYSTIKTSVAAWPTYGNRYSTIIKQTEEEDDGSYRPPPPVYKRKKTPSYRKPAPPRTRYEDSYDDSPYRRSSAVSTLDLVEVLGQKRHEAKTSRLANLNLDVDPRPRKKHRNRESRDSSRQSMELFKPLRIGRKSPTAAYPVPAIDTEGLPLKDTKVEPSIAVFHTSYI